MAAVTTASATTLVKVGFSPRGAAALRATSPDWKTVLRTGALSSRQVRTLRAGSLTLAKLIRGGFTHAQAKLILGL